MRAKYLIVFLLLILLVPLPPATQAQTVLTLGVPEFALDFINRSAIEEFELAYSVEVELVGLPPNATASPEDDLDTHFEEVEELVTQADVILVTTGAFVTSLTPEATQAGYFLDLTPLASVDSDLQIDDFYPAALQSLQWNNGLWGLPLRIDPRFLNYDPLALDEAGVPYPDANWTVDDFAFAVEQLTVYDTNGEVITPGLLLAKNDHAQLLRSLLDANLHDGGTPSFDHPDLTALFSTWRDLANDGHFGNRGFSGDYLDIPIRLGSVFELLPFMEGQNPRNGSLLPNGYSTAQVTSLAISAGTQQPELAYELAKSLSKNIEFNQTINGLLPARQSQANLDGMLSEEMLSELSPDNQTLLRQALDNMLTPSDLLFFNYLDPQADSGLPEMEAEAFNNWHTAAETTVELVIIPPAQVELAPGEIALNFGMISVIPFLPNVGEWNNTIDSFVATDPDVGAITLDVRNPPFDSQDLTAWALEQEYDCYYLPTNVVSGASPENLLSLDPFIFDDPNFDANDFVGNVLSQVQRDNRTWALPLEIRPQVIWTAITQLEQAGLSVPVDGWNEIAFEDAIRALYNDNIVFDTRLYGSNYLLMLMAAYGALPIDYRTTPPTIDFTTPDTVEIIRRVLDFTRDEVINYSALDFVEGVSYTSPMGLPPFYTETLSALGVSGMIVVSPSGGGAGGGGGGGPELQVEPIPFPQGDEYTAVSYEIGAGYISSQAENPAACYRWFQTLSDNPQLLSGMPARYSAHDNPAVAAAHGEAATTFYNTYSQLLQAPNLVEFPAQLSDGSSPGSAVYYYWLNRAFDHYVLKDADLETELAEAQLVTQTYLDCVADIPPYNPADYAEPAEYDELFITCVKLADPSLDGFFR